MKQTLFETESLTDKELYKNLHSKIDLLGKKLNRFLKSIQEGHLSEK